MPLRFLADHCISNSMIRELRMAGHEVIRLSECMLVESRDSEVIARAQGLGALLLSLNGDFADIVSYPPARYKGIVTLQVRNHPEIIPQLMEKLKAHLSNHDDMKHYSGRLLVVETYRIRSRV